jgi:hypothetical protein
VAVESYETIALRIPAREIEDEADDAGYWNWSYWDPDTNRYNFRFTYRCCLPIASLRGFLVMLYVPNYLDQLRPDTFSFYLMPSSEDD